MRRTVAVFLASTFAVPLPAQQPTTSQTQTIQMECRDMSTTAAYMEPNETVINGKACHPVSTPAKAAEPVANPAVPADAAPQAAPQKDASVATDAAPKGTVTLATMLENGTMQPLVPDWAIKWVQKNDKKYPGVRFQTSGSRSANGNNFLIVFSSSARVLQGFQPVTRTETSTSTSQVSGNGMATSNNGSTWNYTVNGTVDTTTTTTVHDNVGYTQNTNILYVTAYDENGTMVAQKVHVYSTQQGGDPSYAAGYNLGNAFRAINARGKTLELVVNHIEGRKQ